MTLLLAIGQPEPSRLASAAANSSDDADGEANQRLGSPENLRVLIVEDEFFIALDVQEQVETLGHEVVGVAVSADEETAMAAREKPDVVLMDIRLSGPRDGIDAAVEIRDHFGIQSIFVTANTDPATLQRAHAIEPLGVLNKPVTHMSLRQHLSRIKPT